MSLEKISSFCKQFYSAVYFLVMGIVMILLIFAEPFLTYCCKKNFLLPNGVLLPLGLAILWIVTVLVLRKKSGVNTWPEQKLNRMILAGTVVLFVLQIILCYNIYSYPGFDAGGTILPYGKALAEGDYAFVNGKIHYFSAYTNNIFLLWLFSKIFKLNMLMGITTMEQGLMTFLVIQCLLSDCTGLLIYRVTRSICRENLTALAAWTGYILLIGFSPWLVITYSDSMGLIFPLLLFFLYTKIRDAGHTGVRAALCFLSGILIYFGYKLKPQIVIMPIAIGLVLVLKLLRGLRQKTAASVRKQMSLLVAFVCAVLVSSFLYGRIEADTHLELNAEEAFGITHYIMMGLNEEKDGCWYKPDIDLSVGYMSVEARTEANIDVIKDRLKEYGVGGFLYHTVKKCLVNYGDGTFAWGMEGGSFLEVYEERNDTLSPWLRSFYYEDGENHNYLATWLQLVWLVTLALGMVSGAALFFGGRQTNEEAGYESVLILMLSVVGITAFELLCEARARYLFIYAPVYVILAAMGWKALRDASLRRVKAGMKRSKI